MWDIAKGLFGLVLTIFIVAALIRVINLPEEKLTIQSFGRSAKGVTVDFINGWNETPSYEIDSLEIVLKYTEDHNIKLQHTK